MQDCQQHAISLSLAMRRYNYQLLRRMRPPLSGVLLQTVKIILENPKDGKQAEELFQFQQGRWVTYFPTG